MTPMLFAGAVVGLAWLGSDPRPWQVAEQLWSWLTERDTEPYIGRHRDR